MDPYSNDPNMNMTPVIKTQPSSNASVPMKPMTSGAIPSPNSFGPAPTPWSQEHENIRLQQKRDPVGTDTYNLDYGGGAGSPGAPAQEKIYQRPDGTWADSGGGDRDVNTEVDFDWDSYLKDIESLYQDTRGTPTDTQVSVSGGYDPLGGAGGGAGGGGVDWRGSMPKGGGVIYQGPVFDYPELNLPEPFEYGSSLDLPDYAPPEYDEANERAIREEFIQTNKGALSKSAQQAILGSANVNNPQARGQIIKAALEGFGEALGQTALKGSQEGRRAAEKQYGRDVGVYNTQFDVASKETLASYDQSMREDLMNWELELSTAQADYQNQLSQWNRMPGDLQAQNMPT